MADRLAQHRVTLGREQFPLGRTGLVIREVPGVGCGDGRVRPLYCAPDPDALALGDGGEPPGQGGRIADLVQLVHQAHPDLL
jgi:hypothetical protein